MKRLRQSLNSDIEILDLPAPYVGKYMDVKKTITKTLGGLVSIYMYTLMCVFMHMYMYMYHCF